MSALKKAIIALVLGMVAFEVFIGRIMVRQGIIQTKVMYVLVECLFSAAVMGGVLLHHYRRKTKKAAEDNTHKELAAQPVSDTQPVEAEEYSLQHLFVDATNECLKAHGHDEVDWTSQDDRSLGTLIRVFSERERMGSYVESVKCFGNALHCNVVPIGLKVQLDQIDRFAELFNTMNTYALDGGFELNPDETEGQFVRYRIQYDGQEFAQPDRFGNAACETKECIESTGMTTREACCVVQEPLRQFSIWEEAIDALQDSATEYRAALNRCIRQAEATCDDHSTHFEEMKKMSDSLIGEDFSLLLDGFGFRWARAKNGCKAELKDRHDLLLQMDYKEHGILITAYFAENGARDLSPEQERMLYRQLARYNISSKSSVWCCYNREKGLAARYFFLYNCKDARVSHTVWTRSIYCPVEVLLDFTTSLNIPGLVKPDCAGIENAIRLRMQRKIGEGLGDAEYEAELWNQVKVYYEVFGATFNEEEHECEFENRCHAGYTCRWHISVQGKSLSIFGSLKAEGSFDQASGCERVLTMISQLNGSFLETEFKLLSYDEESFCVRYWGNFKLGRSSMRAQPPMFADVMWINRQAVERDKKLLDLYQLAKGDA